MAPKTQQQYDPRLNNPIQNLQQALGFKNLGFLKPRYTPQQMRSMTAPPLVRYPENVPGNVGSKVYSGVIGSIPPSANGESYRRAELRLADAARPGGGGGGGGNAGYSVFSTAGTDYQPAAERSYQQEVSRTAQLTAQDPELQRYEKARKIAAAQGATPESVKTAEDIGMQIWAKKYGGPGGLASKVKPGQAGYEAIQGVIAPGRGTPGSTNLYQGAFPDSDYRDYGEPPTGAAAIPEFNTPAITGVAAQTVVPQLDPAQVKAQDLVESFKKGVFDPDLMEQIASSIYNR
jgi:hypothetical protein